jgi:hypothetical protein
MTEPTPSDNHAYHKHDTPNHAYTNHAYDFDKSDFFLPVSKPSFSGYERVPSELSGKNGKGRTGKIDSCIDCGDDYLVKIHNATRCEKCSKDNQQSYAKARLNKQA